MDEDTEQDKHKHESVDEGSTVTAAVTDDAEEESSFPAGPEESIKEGTPNLPVQEESTDKSNERTDGDGDDDDSSHIDMDPAVMEKLTTGVLGLFLPNLQTAKGSLNEVLHNQEVLLESIQQENAKFKDSAGLQELVDTMQQARVYHGKLVSLKREMAHLMDKSTKLKRRAVKLQQQKKKEELNKEREMEKEQERERALAPKIANRAKDSPDKSTAG